MGAAIDAIVREANRGYWIGNRGPHCAVRAELIEEARWELWELTRLHSGMGWFKWNRMMGAMYVKVHGVGGVRIDPLRED